MKHLHKGPVFLLTLAFCFAGAKSPLLFSLWSVFAMALAMAALCFQLPDESRILRFLLFSVGLVLCQIYSLDPTNSFYWTTQVFTCASLWLILPIISKRAEPWGIWPCLVALGIVTGAFTTFQWVRHQPLYGALPINPNFNAVWMAALASALMAKPQKQFLERFLIIWLSALIILGISRSGLLALLLGASYVGCHRYGRTNVFWSLFILGTLAVLIPHEWLFNRLYIYENGGRSSIWMLAARSILDFPLTGYGPGNFEIAYQRYAFPIEGAVRYARTTAFAHNDALQMFSEFGWPITGGLLVGLWGCLRRPVKGDAPWEIASKAMLLAIGLASCFNPLLKMPILIFLILLCVTTLESPQPPNRKIAPLQAFRLKTACLLVMACTMLSSLAWGFRSYWASQKRWDLILRWNPSDGEAWHELAYLTADINAALNAHRRAVQLSPHQLYYAEALARALENRSEKEFIPQALEMYLAAIQLAPGRAINYLAAARLLWRAGEPSQALLWIEKARALELYYWECDLWQSRCLARLGQNKKARFVLRNLIRRHEVFDKRTLPQTNSAYEQAILNYSEPVVREEMARFRSL